MKAIYCLPLALFLAGCAGLGATGMTTKQIEALGELKAAATFCNNTEVEGYGIKVKSTTSLTKVDKESGPKNGMAVSPQCGYGNGGDVSVGIVLQPTTTDQRPTLRSLGNTQ